MSIVYCQVCSLPPEYCEFNPKKIGQCKAWVERAHPDLFQELYGEAKEEQKTEQATESPANNPPEENEPSENDEDESNDEENDDEERNEQPAPEIISPPSRRLPDDSENSDDGAPPPQEAKKKKRRRRPRKKRNQNEETRDGDEDDDENDEDEAIPQNPNRRRKGRGGNQQPPPQPASRRRVAPGDYSDEDEDESGEDDQKTRGDRKVRFQEPAERPARNKRQASQQSQPKKFIGVSTVTRRGNKKLTVVRGLMEFGMKPKKAQSAFRKKFASGVGVNTRPDGKEEIVVQGECRYDMMRFLNEKWKVPPGLLFYQARNGTLTPGYTAEGMCLPPP